MNDLTRTYLEYLRMHPWRAQPAEIKGVIDMALRIHDAEREIVDLQRRVEAAEKALARPREEGSLSYWFAHSEELTDRNRTLEAALRDLLRECEVYALNDTGPMKQAREALAPDAPAGERQYVDEAAPITPEAWESLGTPDPQRDEALAAHTMLTALRDRADIAAAQSGDPALQHSEVGDWVRAIRRHIEQKQCPYIVTSSEGTSYCVLAEQQARRVPEDKEEE